MFCGFLTIDPLFVFGVTTLIAMLNITWANHSFHNNKDKEKSLSLKSKSLAHSHFREFCSSYSSTSFRFRLQCCCLEAKAFLRWMNWTEQAISLAEKTGPRVMLHVSLQTIDSLRRLVSTRQPTNPVHNQDPLIGIKKKLFQHLTCLPSNQTP